MTLKEIIKDNKVYFDFYRSGTMYYTVEVGGRSYRYSIPLDDVGNGTLPFMEKAITHMRWIRKALESNELVKV